MIRRVLFRSSMLVGLVLLFVTTSAFAQTNGDDEIQDGDIEQQVIHPEFSEVQADQVPMMVNLIREADLALIGQATSVVSNYVTNEWGDQLILSDVGIRIEETLIGATGDDRKLKLRGVKSGTVDEMTMYSSDAPLFVEGERFVLFLATLPDGSVEVIGGNIGKALIDGSGYIPQFERTLEQLRGDIQSETSRVPQTTRQDDDTSGNSVDVGNADLDQFQSDGTLGPQYTISGSWAGTSPVVTYRINNPGFNDAGAGSVAQQNMAINLAADTWAVAGGARFTYRSGGLTATNTVTLNSENVVMVRNASGGGALATAFWWVNNSNNIIDCDIVFWDGQHAFTAINTGFQFDIRSVALHELGHCLGLLHSNVGGSVMWPSIGGGSRNQLPRSDDLAGLRVLYSVGAVNLWIREFGYTAGDWRVTMHPRLMGDVNGDGKDDVVGFANSGVRVALSTGNRFVNSTRWVENFGYNAGTWRVDKHPRLLADVNGDGLADVVGFANAGVSVATSTGMGFNFPSLWTSSFGYNRGWRVGMHPRFMADVNGDGKDDVIGFGNAGVSVATSTGTSFNTPTLWSIGYGYDSGWRESQHPRMIADVNGDGRADIVGFGYDGVYVSTSTGTTFTPPTIWSANFGYSAGNWRVDRHPRFMADVNGDGRDDVVGFGNAGVSVAISTGTTFNSPSLWIKSFGYNSSWRVPNHPRHVVDVTGDGRADIVGFGNAGTFVARSSGHHFESAVGWVHNYGYNAGTWRTENHPRFLADVDGDGRADVVGFREAGVYVSRATYASTFE